VEIIVAPEIEHHQKPTLFLAGSIEQDIAEEWQEKICQLLVGSSGTIFSPRRKHWDASLPNLPDNPVFREQVEWELEHILKADLILFYFQSGTLSPISLLELGLVVGRRKEDVYIVCQKDFWRYGNVCITAEQTGLPVFETFEEVIPLLENRLKALEARN
jgi:hypothetical protein